jgi:superfamily II DNA or RNA helicase
MEKNNIEYNSYLGPKGYTLLKKEISIEKQKQIRNDLTIKPFIMGSLMSSNNQKCFPVYRESLHKFYLPHYYGIENFGPIKKYKINEGIDTDLLFAGNLRENQEKVVKTYIDHVVNVKYGGGLLELPCASGKTVIALNIISKLKKKTLIIVHKEFLMNQWIERIEQFLPNARIGKIQGQIIDTDNKDIVIGMLQSISMKEYSTDTFDSFGFTVIDEVHHISSEVFSNSLFKLISKYMLGLSATMNRKDGTTDVFKMFLGDVIYKGSREEQMNVIVRAIEYIVDDDDFNEVILDYKGNPAYSSMISKLCEYNRRSEFILKVISDMFKETSSQQIMVLAHNKNLLKYLYDAIKYRNIATVGYYIGGMKEQSLKETETKQVVIATYSMAAEALDIKTLTTLIMATPKTDIEQSVGRILRVKHSQPIVVDIIDKHKLFKNQWAKRKTFYKKENYKIIYTSNKNYTPDTSRWTTLVEPTENGAKIVKPKIRKSCSEKSNTSTDKSIATETDEEDSEIENNKPKDKYLCGKCLLKT